MKNYWENTLKIKSTIVLLVFSLFCLALSMARVFMSNDYFFLFLVWNLFLAFIPWLISSVMMVCEIKNRVIFFLLFAVWLLFFPNAPYILTDIVHINVTAPKYRWLDLLLSLSYAFCGLYYAFVSLLFVEKALVKQLKFKHTFLFSVVVWYLAGFGIYLGRFLRWNSWDLLANLQGVVVDIFDRFSNPFEHWTVWGFTFTIGTLLNLLYWSYRSFNTETEE